LNTEYLLPVCEEHVIELSFTKDYKMPKHWRKHTWCTKRNCPRKAEYWLLIDLKDVMPFFIERGQSQLAGLVRA
jgi:hypothetical protein